MIVVWLFPTLPRACLQFVIVVFLDHIHLPFMILITMFCELSSQELDSVVEVIKIRALSRKNNSAVKCIHHRKESEEHIQ